MKRRRQIGVVLAIVILANLNLQAQEARLKFGFGANYISNNYDEAYLNDYLAYSLNTSYSILQQPKFSVLWEQNFSLRNRETDRFRKQAFIASFPIAFRYQASAKTGIYVGVGPTYLSHKYEDYSIRQRVRGLQATAVTGVALRTKPFAEVMFLEYHLRAGMHRSIDGRGNMAPFLSVLMQLGSLQRVERLN